jgi:hypothetical protein
MGGAVPPLPQYAFMAWCSVRGSRGTTLPFTLTFYPLLGTEEECTDCNMDSDYMSQSWIRFLSVGCKTAVVILGLITVKICDNWSISSWDYCFNIVHRLDKADAIIIKTNWTAQSGRTSLLPEEGYRYPPKRRIYFLQRHMAVSKHGTPWLHSCGANDGSWLLVRVYEQNLWTPFNASIRK